MKKDFSVQAFLERGIEMIYLMIFSGIAFLLFSMFTNLNH